MTTATRHRRSAIRAKLQPEQVTAIVDTREQCPLDLTPLRTITGTLTTGDISIFGLEHVVSIERKSLSDLLCCVGRERERFDREVHRLLAYPVRALIIEASWADIEAGNWRSEIKPAQALGSVLGWIASGLPVIMAGDHQRAGRYAARLLFIAASRRWREARALVQTVTDIADGADGLDTGHPPEHYADGATAAGIPTDWAKMRRKATK